MSNEIKIKTSVDNTGTKVGLKETQSLVKKSANDITNEFKTLGDGLSKAFSSITKGDITGAFKALAGSIGPVSIGITAIAGAATIASKEINRMITEGGKIADLALALDMTSEQYQKLDLMAQLAGSSIEKISKSMIILAKNAYEASNGSKSAQQAFDSLGISVRDSNGELKTKEELLKETFISLSKVKNSTEQTAIAQQLLGKSAAELAPIYRSTTTQIEDYFNKMGYGVTYTNDMVQNTDKLGDSMLILGKEFEKVKNDQLDPLISSFASLTTWLIKVREQNRETPFGMDPDRVDKHNASIQRLQTGFGKTNEELIKMGFSTMEIISIHQMYEAEIKKSNQESYIHSESISDIDKNWKSGLLSLQNYGAEFSVVKNQASTWSMVPVVATKTEEELAAAKKIADDAAKKRKSEEAERKAAREQRLKEELAYIDKIKEYADQNQINLWSSDKKVVDGVAVDKTPEEIKKDQLAIINAKYNVELESIKALEKEDVKRGTNKFNDAAELAKTEMAWIIERSEKEQSLDKQTADKAKRLADEQVTKQKEQQKIQEEATNYLGNVSAELFEKINKDYFKDLLSQIRTEEDNIEFYKANKETKLQGDAEDKKDELIGEIKDTFRTLHLLMGSEAKDEYYAKKELVKKQRESQYDKYWLEKQDQMNNYIDRVISRNAESIIKEYNPETYEDFLKAFNSIKELKTKIGLVNDNPNQQGTVENLFYKNPPTEAQFNYLKTGEGDNPFKETKYPLWEGFEEEFKENYKKDTDKILTALYNNQVAIESKIEEDVEAKFKEVITPKRFLLVTDGLDVVGKELMEKLGKIRKKILSEPFGILEGLIGSKESIDKTFNYFSTIQNAKMGLMAAQNDLSNAKLQQDLDNKSKAHEKEISGLRLTNRAKVREEQKYQKEVDKLKEEQKEKDKKFKIANVWMNFASGVMSAWSTSMQFGPIAGPIFGGIMTGLLTATALKQVELINKYQDGGIVPGASFSGDKVPAMVNSGEMILNAGQQRRLFDIANNGGGSQPTQIVINGNVTQDHLQELEDMLYKLNSKSRLSFIGGR